jgi:hypothetical protein
MIAEASKSLLMGKRFEPKVAINHEATDLEQLLYLPILDCVEQLLSSCSDG